MNRTVEHNYDPDQLEQLREQCTSAKVDAALGYLSTWSIMTYPQLSLLILGDAGCQEILAAYRKEPGGPVSYAIGAVWHDDHFGFHS